MTNSASIGQYVSNTAALPSSAQPWAKEMERRLIALEGKTSDLSTSGAKVSSVLAAWTPLVGKITGLESGMSDAGALGEAANSAATDAVTWSTERPVSPADDGSVAGADVPLHDDATWFVYELVNGERQVKEVWRWVPPTFEVIEGTDDTESYIDSEGEWIQERFGTDTLGEGAVDLRNLSAALSDDLAERTAAVEALQQRQSEFETQYAAQQAALNERINELQLAAGTDGRVIVSATEPQGADRHEGNLWINTANGGSAPYRYDTGTDTWVTVADPAAVEAAAKAAAADANAEAALKAVQEAEDKALAAELAATAAQASADAKNRIFYGRTKPTLAGRVDGDLWFDAANGYTMYTYSVEAQDFVLVDFTAGLTPEEKQELQQQLSDVRTLVATETAKIGQQAADDASAKMASAIAAASADAQSKADAAKTAAIAAVSDSISAADQRAQDAANAAAQALTAANGKNKVTRSTASPSASTPGSVAGDVWWRYASSDLSGAIIGQWTWNGTEWKPSTIDSRVIASLTVDKLAVTGGAKFNSAVMNTLIADDIFADAVNTSALTVGASQRVTDPEFTMKDKFWGSSSSQWRQDVKFRESQWVQGLKFSPGETYGTRYSLMQRIDNRFAVTPGEVLTAKTWWYTPESWAVIPDGRFSTQVYFYGPTISVQTGVVGSNNVTAGALLAVANAPVGKWFETGGQVTVPEGAVYATVRPTLYCAAGESVAFTKDSWCYIGRVECSSAIGTVDIRDGVITAPKLAAGAVTADKIAANAIVAEKIAAGAIVSEKIAANAITTNHIKANAVTADKVDVNSLQANVVRTASLDAGKITSGTLSADRIAAGSITSAKLNVGDIQANVVKTASLDASQIKTGTLSAALITADSLRGKTLRIDGTVNKNAFIEMTPTSMGGRIHGAGGTGGNGGTFSFGHNDNGMPHLYIRDPLGNLVFSADSFGVKVVDSQLVGGEVLLSYLAQSWNRRFERNQFSLPRRTSIGSWAFYQVGSSLSALSFSFTPTASYIQISNTNIFDQASNGTNPVFFVAQVGLYTNNSTSATSNLHGGKAYAQTITTGNAQGGGQMVSTTEIVEVTPGKRLWVKPISRFLNNASGAVTCNNWRSSISITYP